MSVVGVQYLVQGPFLCCHGNRSEVPLHGRRVDLYNTLLWIYMVHGAPFLI